MPQDRLLEPLQRLAGLNSELVDQVVPGLLVRLESIRLAVGPVEGKHLLGAQAFPQPVFADEHVQLAQHLLMSTEREVAVDPVHQRRQPELVELGDLFTAVRFEQQTRQGRTAPKAEPLAQELGSRFEFTRGLALARGGEQLPEARNVQLIVVDSEAVAAVRRPNRVVTVASQRLAQLGDVDVDGLLRRRRRRRAPELVVNRSRETNSFACRSKTARTSRSFSRPSATGPPSSTTSSGPRIRYSTARFYRFPSQNGSARSQVCLSDRSRRLTSARQSRGVARSLKPVAPDTASYHGEVWTDARGYATVRLPAEAAPLEPPVEYEMQDLEPPSTARVTGELKDGRFTIHTDEPHVKVAWRLTGRRPAGHLPHPPHEEETT